MHLILAVFLALAPAAGPTPMASGCTDAQIATTGCPGVQGAIEGDSANIIGNTVIPGTNPSTPQGPGPYVDAPGGPVDPRAHCNYIVNDLCHQTIARPGEPADPEDAAPTVTLSDIASFTPQLGTTGMEPQGWAIVRLPANFYSGASEHVQSGTLLGQPAEVRFTPVSYSWDYGDGTTAAFAHPGASWADLGLDEFESTPTSHTFTSEGTYTVQHTVTFVAAFRFAGGPWTPIAGTLSVPGPAVPVVVGDADTVLVELECTANPSGPGC